MFARFIALSFSVPFVRLSPNEPSEGPISTRRRISAETKGAPAGNAENLRLDPILLANQQQTSCAAGVSGRFAYLPLVIRLRLHHHALADIGPGPLAGGGRSFSRLARTPSRWCCMSFFEGKEDNETQRGRHAVHNTGRPAGERERERERDRQTDGERDRRRDRDRETARERDRDEATPREEVRTSFGAGRGLLTSGG